MSKRLVLVCSIVAATLVLGTLTAPGAELKRQSPTRDTRHSHPGKKVSARLAEPLAAARVATAKYATDLDAATTDGYGIITRMIPDMGYHFLNPSITEFDVTKPQALVYVRNGDEWQLGALEWVFPEKPEKKPLPGAKYGSFGAACHYEDGTFVFEESEANCPEASPETGTAFAFWHPDLVTMHVWLWYPNPAGLFSGTNPLVTPFNDEVVP